MVVAEGESGGRLSSSKRLSAPGALQASDDCLWSCCLHPRHQGGCGCGCEEGEGEGEEGGEVHCIGVGGWEFVAFDQVSRKPGELASLGSGVIWC